MQGSTSLWIIRKLGLTPAPCIWQLVCERSIKLNHVKFTSKHFNSVTKKKKRYYWPNKSPIDPRFYELAWALAVDMCTVALIYICYNYWQPKLYFQLKLLGFWSTRNHREKNLLRSWEDDKEIQPTCGTDFECSCHCNFQLILQFLRSKYQAMCFRMTGLWFNY